MAHVERLVQLLVDDLATVNVELDRSRSGSVDADVVVPASSFGARAARTLIPSCRVVSDSRVATLAVSWRYKPVVPCPSLEATGLEWKTIFAFDKVIRNRRHETYCEVILTKGVAQ
jgi:hypothetical protein